MDNNFFDGHGRHELILGEGRISGYIASLLGVGSLLGVVCFRYLEYLTTVEMWPLTYGVIDSPAPDGFLNQFVYPFRRSRSK
jgi:hypothetical protein